MRIIYKINIKFQTNNYDKQSESCEITRRCILRKNVFEQESLLRNLQKSVFLKQCYQFDSNAPTTSTRTKFQRDRLFLTRSLSNTILFWV